MSRFRLSILISFLVVCVASFGVAPFTMAQTSRGTVQGVVVDATGAVVAKATVKLTQKDTNVKRETTTNEAGFYRFDAVDLGNYTASVRAAGFATEDKTGIQVEAARTLDINFSLKVGTASETITVEASNTEIALQTSEQVRGANFSTRSVENLPILGADSLTLTQLLPGVSLTTGNQINQDGTLNFIVNGQRPRGNNFMIDGVENNDISVTGPAFTITNPDAVQEVNIQTANFAAEFGRAGGAVINQITKSGSNQFHGTATEVYTGSAFKSLDNADHIAHQTRPPRAVENIPDFTFGGPIIRNKTFFFGAAQWDRFFGTITSSPRAADAAGVALLQGLAGACPNAALYLKALGSLRGDPTSSPASFSLAVPNGAVACNGSTRAGQTLTTGLAFRQEAQSSLDNNHLVRVDHTVSQKQTMSFRWLYDKFTFGPSLNNLPGFDRNLVGDTLTGSFTDTYVINSRMTNEFRFNYGRIGFNFPLAATDTFHATLANYSGINVTGFGGATNIPQFRFANNWQYSDTMSLVRGKHTFRFGADFLRQLARQHPPFNERGSFVYSSSTTGGTVTAFANFLDDFGGRSGSLNRQFGSPIYRPNLFRQSYFFQDSWKTTSNLTLNLGLRYEDYGAPENIFTVAAFTNYDPVNFAAPHKVDPYLKNFGPSVGFAWNPKGQNFINRMMGGRKTVWRGGYQISYDSAFNNLLSNIAGSSPNTLGGNIVSASSAGAPRGAANFSTLFAGIIATPATKESAQTSVFLLPFPNPQTQRWSLGFERELPYGLFWDTSYVGSVSHHLYRTIDMNPIVNLATGDRLHTELQSSLVPSVRAGQGIRQVRAASANSNYESLQFNLKRNFRSTPLGEVLFEGSYTYAHFLDDVSDVFAFDSTPSSFQSVSQVLGASPHIDYGNSDFDRRHVGAIGLVWDLRGPKTGFFGQIFGGWQVAGIAHWQTGVPFTPQNGTDRNGDGQAGPDRPDIGNLAAPLNTRAVINAACVTGFSNPDVVGGPCVDPNTVHFIEGIGLPNARTAARNSLFAPGISNLDMSFAKRIKFGEQKNLEFRVDMFNALNEVNFGTVPINGRTINSGTTLLAGQTQQFMNFALDNSIGRSMRMRLKFTF